MSLSILERVKAAGSLATEIFSPVSARDVRAGVNVISDLGKTGRKGKSVTLETESGNSYLGNSTRSSCTGGDAREPMNPEIQASLDAVENPSGSHGACCEIDAMNKALNRGDSLRGAKMGQVKDNQTGEVIPPCSTCREVKAMHGVE